MVRIIAAVAGGALLWIGLEGLLHLAAISLWPDYAAAAPTRNFDLSMLIARLVSGALVTLIVGAVVARIDGSYNKAVRIFAALLLVVAVAHHLQPSVWNGYPLWYHLVFWAYLVPLTLLGGRLVGARVISALGVSV